MSFNYDGDPNVGDLILEMALPSDGDLEDASSVDVPFEALIDNFAAIHDGDFTKAAGTFAVAGTGVIDIGATGTFTSAGHNTFTSNVSFFGSNLFHGEVDLFTTTVVKSGATLFIDAGAFEIVTGALGIVGTQTISSGGIFQVLSTGTFELEAGCTALVDAGAVFDISGTAKFESGALADFRNGAIAEWRSGATADFKSGSELHLESGMDAVWDIVGGAITYDATTLIDDSSSTTRRGPTDLNGNDATIGWRVVAYDGASGRPNGDQDATFNVSHFDVIYASTLTATRHWRLAAPPSGRQCYVKIVNGIPGFPTGNDLVLKDDGTGATLLTLPPVTGARFVYSNGSNGVAAGWALVD